MKVLQTQVNLSGQGVHLFHQQQNESLSLWNRLGRIDATRKSVSDGFSYTREDTADLSDAAKKLAEQAKQLAAQMKSASAPAQQNATLPNLFAPADGQDDEFGISLDPISWIKIMIIEAMTGMKVRFFDPSKMRQDMSQAQSNATDAAQKMSDSKTPAGQPEPAPQGWGVAYSYHEETVEIEKSSFTASGVVKTADGKEISFKANLEMSRETVSVKDLSFRAGDAVKDPLVINFDGTAAQLTDNKVNFDLNSDGRNEKMSFVKSGSGFLVWDRNGDGAVNNGGELFGPKSGNGFAELAAQDTDRNGWIDENDPIYSQLRLWTKDDQGADSLSTLKDTNIGAIYTKSAATPFDLKDSQDETQGKVRATGVYLTEDGQAKTVQQVDLVS